MANERVQRRLAAILAADVVGYSRLMGKDEAGTLARLKSLRSEVFNPEIRAAGGRVFKVAGDGALAEFASAANAVNSAVAVQRALAERNTAVPETERIELRIGISLGDVMVEGTDLYGNGVNVAARMEGLAEPGGICISANVHEHIANAPDLTFEDIGDQSVKNTDRPVRCYRVAARDSAGHAAPAPEEPAKIAEKPSIAVLPFDNLSGDPGQDFIGDGLTEDIITALSRLRSFFVIARNSTFQYKGTSPDVRKVASELAVQYVVEGSVRRAGDRLRVTAQLIDGRSGNHVWAERFDREFADLFDIQDEITRMVAARLEPELIRAEYERARSTPTENLDAWSLYHRGMALMFRRSTTDIAEARRLFEAATELDPSLASAFAGIAWTCAEDFMFGTHEYAIDRAFEAARRAVTLDDRNAFAHYALGWAYHFDRQTEPAVAAAETAIRINPSFAMAHTLLGGAYIHGGRPKDGIPHVELAIRLSPADPSIGLWYTRLAAGHLYAGETEKAVAIARTGAQLSNNWVNRVVLASALGHHGPQEEARRACEELVASQPGMTTRFVREHYFTSHEPSANLLIEGLRKGGLPD